MAQGSAVVAVVISILATAVLVIQQVQIQTLTARQQSLESSWGHGRNKRSTDIRLDRDDRNNLTALWEEIAVLKIKTKSRHIEMQAAQTVSHTVIKHHGTMEPMGKLLWNVNHVSHSDHPSSPFFEPIADSHNIYRGIRLVKPGFYFVYAQVTFNGTSKRYENGHINKYHTVSMMKHPSGYGYQYHTVVSLAKTTVTQSRIRGVDVQPMDSVYIGRIFRLDARDELWLGIKNRHSKVVFNKNTFFGVFHIGDGRD